jgi:4-amino-4-deoxy-L-arabinose transferase-like glycosyltransferase
MSSVILYVLAKRMTGSKTIATFAVLIFSLSPLAIYYHRRVLLDNMMTMFLLLSLFLALSPRRYVRLFLSPLIFGMAFLVKESALMFLIPFAYAVFLAGSGMLSTESLNTNSRRSASMGALVWTIVSLAVIALYPLFAFLREN